ncbi:unnamed protein product [Debaryomyces fabryi]|nr:unnamed protein product [Debaryomyces fabryi]|mmetsp:Transcript_9503/g.9387  ORF Transcript_9503/g.9387 Transcript_9503/m.9387 type:complete len:89 (+) Transcript_9503:31-297(+)
MAQGNLKLKAKGPKKVVKKLLTPKKATPKIIKPKKAPAKQATKLTKVQQGHLMNSTERLIAGRVGHLELIKGSRRQLEKEEKAKSGKK